LLRLSAMISQSFTSEGETDSFSKTFEKRNFSEQFGSPITPSLGYGRGAGVGRGRGVGVHLPVHGVAVGVGVGVAVGVDVAVGVAFAVGVGVGVGAPDSAQYLPPVLKIIGAASPPQTIISVLVHTAV